MPCESCSSAWIRGIDQCRAAAVADPAEDVPADGHLGQRDRDLRLRALGARVAGAGPVGSVFELADQLNGPVQGVDASSAAVADKRLAAVRRTGAVEDVEFLLREACVVGPVTRRRANLPRCEPPSAKPPKRVNSWKTRASSRFSGLSFYFRRRVDCREARVYHVDGVEKKAINHCNDGK